MTRMRGAPCRPFPSVSSAAGSPGEGPLPPGHGAREGPPAVAGHPPPGPSAATATACLSLLLLSLLPLPCGADDDEQPCPTRISSNFFSKWVSEEGALNNGAGGPCEVGLEPFIWGRAGAGQCKFCNSTATGVCSGKNVTRLPDARKYPRSMRYLQVTESDIEAVPAEAFQGLLLERIEIDDNQKLSGQLDDMAFKGVMGLRKLNITRSGLTQINFKWLRGLKDLENLSFEDNNINFICGLNASEDSNGTPSIGGVEHGSNHLNSSDDVERLVPNLRYLNLSKNKLSCLSQHDFVWLRYSKLKSLKLRGISLSAVENGALLVVSKTLRELDISDSSLDDDLLLIPLLSSFSGNASSLQDLSLAYLGLNRMPHTTLKLVNHTLIHLSLYGNNFHKISTFSFPIMNQLQELDLRYCDIKTIEPTSFENLPNIKTLLLSNNRITNVDGIFIGLNSLKNLDFSHNLGLKTAFQDTITIQGQLDKLGILSERVSDIIFPPSLISLDLSFTEIQKIESFTFKGLSNLQNLSVCYSKLSDIANRSQPFRDLKKLKVLDMSGNPWLEMNLSSWIFNGLSSLQELHLDSISNGKNYGYDLKSFSTSTDSPFHNLSSLRLLSIKQNYIHTLSMSIFSPLTGLETLYLSDNHLISWDSPLFSGNKNLNLITLHQNQISYISDTMLNEFKSLSQISLYGNPILCNCEVWKFASLAKSKKIGVIGWDEGNSYMCIDKSEKNYAKFDGNWSLECEKEANTDHGSDSLIASSSTSISSWANSINYIIIIIIIFIACLAIFLQKKCNYLQFFRQLIRNVGVISLMNDKKGTSDKSYNYDVFVSYCDHDRQWVLNELLPKLEMKNNTVDDSKQPGPAFKVCLHERDFQVGSSILENIMSCMDNSRMILLVVSSTFLRSQWCQFEMHLAQHRLLETRRDDLLLVLLEEIPQSKRPKTLHYLMATKTYIVWNKETNDLFWKRIRRAIKPNPSEKEKSISSFP